MLDLEPIKARVVAAAEGPWRTYKNPMRDDGVFIAQDKPIVAYSHVTGVSGEPHFPAIPLGVWSIESQVEPKTAEFIAYARTDVPALVAEVERLRGLLSAVLVEQVCGEPDDVMSSGLEKAIHNAIQ